MYTPVWDDLLMCLLSFLSLVFIFGLCLHVNQTLTERIFVGRSHVAKVAEARLEQINRYCQVCDQQLPWNTCIPLRVDLKH